MRGKCRLGGAKASMRIGPGQENGRTCLVVTAQQPGHDSLDAAAPAAAIVLEDLQKGAAVLLDRQDQMAAIRTVAALGHEQIAVQDLIRIEPRSQDAD